MGSDGGDRERERERGMIVMIVVSKHQDGLTRARMLHENYGLLLQF